MNKYDSGNNNLKITGNTENRVRYIKYDDGLHKKSQIKTNKDFINLKNSNNQECLPFKGISEYSEKFIDSYSSSDKSIPHPKLGFNTISDLGSATQGRPNVNADPRYLHAVSETKTSHQWPQLEKREALDFLYLNKK